MKIENEGRKKKKNSVTHTHTLQERICAHKCFSETTTTKKERNNFGKNTQFNNTWT